MNIIKTIYERMEFLDKEILVYLIKKASSMDVVEMTGRSRLTVDKTINSLYKIGLINILFEGKTKLYIVNEIGMEMIKKLNMEEYND